MFISKTLQLYPLGYQPKIPQKEPLEPDPVPYTGPKTPGLRLEKEVSH